ncbi:MAG TPA: hypothetical protein VH440_10470 [Candidatus Limnocylindrales bacterium]
MPQLSHSADHDPFWDLDGKGAKRSRLQRRFVRTAVLLIGLLVAGVLVTKLPTVDPQYLVAGDGRPVLAGAILALLGSAILIGLSRVRGAADR